MEIKVLYSYDELKYSLDEWYVNLSDEIKHQRYIYNEVSFEEYVLSKMNENEIVLMDLENYSYEITTKSEIRCNKIRDILRK